jgi:Ca2+-binding RTX toxin-like protein
MPLPATKVFLIPASAGSGGYALTPQEPGDFGFAVTGYPTSAWITTMGDVNGDGIAEVVVGVPGNSDQVAGGGRIYVEFGRAAGGAATKLGDTTTSFRIDGAVLNDHAGVSVAAIGNQGGSALPDVLVGAPLADPAGLADAGLVYLVWSTGVAGSVDLNDLNTSGSGEGFAIRGQAAGDHAGHSVAAIADLNGDGRQEILVGAPGNDAGGADAGAAYVVFGRATDTTVLLSSVAAGTGGFRMTGAAAGDAAGSALAAIADLNGDGLSEILVGAPGSDAGGADAGAVYVVFGKATTTAVSLANVAIGTGGWRITGATPGERLGSTIAVLGDVNGDGRPDMLLGAADRAYVVFGKAGTAEVSLADVAAGIGGFAILPEAAGDLAALSVAGGGDLNRDGIADIVIGASHNAEGGANAGAVYVVWGGARGVVDLSAIAMGAGGAKVVGSAGSLAGSSVAVAPDMNGDGAAELVIGSAGLAAEAVRVLYAPASWQPDLNAYGTNGADTLGLGDGGAHPITEGADSIYALGGNDSVSAAGGDDWLDGGAGADTLRGGAGNDGYAVDSPSDVVIEAAGEGADTVFATSSFVLPAEVEALRLMTAGRVGTGNAGDNILVGTTGADTLRGGLGTDTLLGDSGHDSLDGGEGADSMDGGAGNDIYAVDDAGDVVADASGADTVVASLDYTLGAGIEGLQLTGAAHRGTGNALANILAGGAGDDTLAGLGGADTLTGGAGNDAYTVEDAGDRVVELAGGGADTVTALVDHNLAAEVEVLVLSGTAHRGTGNALANLLVGTDGADTLDGGLGADTLVGGAGDDVHVVDNAGDLVIEAAGGGHDLVRAAIGYTLGGDVEDLLLTGIALAGTGNALDNAITGGAGADTLDGAAGADTLAGGGGNDLYRVDHAGDLVIEAAGGGADTVITTVDVTLADEVEALLLDGAARHGTGNAGANLLRGTAGADLLEGLGGADTLDGGGGADTMIGGAGNDTYLITDPGDVVVELADEGFDTVVVSTDWTLGLGIEAVQLLGSGHLLRGNAERNTLSGNTGNDTLDGAEEDDVELGGDGDDVLIATAGRDTLSGGSGNDRFEVHGGGGGHIEDFLGQDTLDASGATGDCTIDLSGEGASTIDGASCELGQGGTAAGPLDLQFLQDVTGSFADDIANVRLLVPQIVAALQAVQPDSTFGVSTFRDKPYGSFGAPGDWVYRQEVGLSTNTAALTAAYAAMVANNGLDAPEAQIEALMQLSLHITDIGFRTNSARFVVLFTDAPFHVAGEGLAAGIPLPNNGDAVMDGVPPGTGEDYPTIAQLKAALEAANIIPIFAVAGGNDAAYQGLVAQLGRGAEVTLTADSSNVVAAITTGLTAVTRTTIEDCWGGAGNDSIRGNAADNRLEGRDGNDTLAGGAGADTLVGGAGNDRYIVEDSRDTLVESSAASGGRDTVESHGDWTLGAGFEALVLRGTATHGVGNAAANTLVANDLGNFLEGLGRNDILTGGLGADTLDGGTGLDRMTGGAGDDLYLVDDAGDLVIELAGGGLDTVIASVSFTLRNQIETLRLVGGATAGTGNASANLIEGSALDNLLSGLRGADTLIGGDGADTLIGGAQADRLVGGAGADAFFFGDLADRGDTIVDFVAAEDAIIVSAAGFGGGLVDGADLAAGHQFVAGAAANQAFGQFLWHAASGRLWFDADGTGPEARLLIATLTPGTALTAADIHAVA